MGQPLVPGITVDRYRIDAVIGAGSMGDVFQGVDVDLDRKVAVKILSERHRDNQELRARFVREAKAVAAISHRNVVQVFTTGTFDDRPYIAMEFLDGIDLGSSVEVNGIWSSLDAARALRDAALGLEGAAKAGLIHRDVKPSNLVLLGDGTVKVTDFGLAKPVNPGDEPALTALGVVVGTPDYIAPEQARGDAIDERVDIYALGGTLYYLLTGVPPFRTGKPSEDKYLKVVARHLRKPAPDARAKNPHADYELAELARQMMSKKPVERPDYAELIDKLGGVIERLSGGGEAPRRVGTSNGGSGKHVSPTPFVGGERPNHFDSGATYNFGGEDDEVDPDESAPTRVRIPTAPPTDDAPRAPIAQSGAPQASFDPAIAKPQVSRVLIATTVIAVLVFLTGLGLLLFGPMPEAPAGETATIPDAGPTARTTVDAAPAAPAEPPAPPEGMILVSKEDGTPWFFIDAEPVKYGAYSKLFPNQKKPTTNRWRNNQPATEVPYQYAESFAEGKQRRLPTPDEWRAAAKTEGFERAARRRWEWVDDGTEGLSAERTVMRGDEAEKRKPVAHRDVVFRTVRDL